MAQEMSCAAPKLLSWFMATTLDFRVRDLTRFAPLRLELMTLTG